MNASGLAFTKMSAGGNDFIVIDNMTAQGSDAASVDSDFVRHVCARALSVGADGVIVIEPSEKAHVKMVYYNADGGRAALCGNGVRCVARMAALKRLAPPDGMVIETDAGMLPAASTLDRPPWFRLPLGVPKVERRSVTLEGGLDAVSRTYEGTFVMVGVPHFVVETRAAHGMRGPEFLSIASRLRRHPDFGPEGTNVDFMTTRDRHALDIRCYERGVEGETLSSGSGCIASALAGATEGRLESPVACRSRAGPVSTVTLIHEPDGSLQAELAGDARVIYTGALNAEALSGFEP